MGTGWYDNWRSQCLGWKPTLVSDVATLSRDVVMRLVVMEEMWSGDIFCLFDVAIMMLACNNLQRHGVVGMLAGDVFFSEALFGSIRSFVSHVTSWIGCSTSSIRLSFVSEAPIPSLQDSISRASDPSYWARRSCPRVVWSMLRYKR